MPGTNTASAPPSATSIPASAPIVARGNKITKFIDYLVAAVTLGGIAILALRILVVESRLTNAEDDIKVLKSKAPAALPTALMDRLKPRASSAGRAQLQPTDETSDGDAQIVDVQESAEESVVSEDERGEVEEVEEVEKGDEEKEEDEKEEEEEEDDDDEEGPPPLQSLRGVEAAEAPPKSSSKRARPALTERSTRQPKR